MRPVKEFPRSAFERPLFEEPSKAHERPDPWTGPKVFVFGGMSLPSKGELGQQYFNAANLLVEAIERNRLEDYKLANPVLYLYRHSLELTLKSVIGSEVEGHNLAQLAEDLRKVAQKRFQQEVPQWIVGRLKELADIDPNSTAFRYAENRDCRRRQYVPVAGEICVNMHHLKQSMSALNAALRGERLALSHDEDFEEQCDLEEQE